MNTKQRIQCWSALCLSAAVVLLPSLGKTDSFPLSNYPMFAASRGRPILNRVVAIDALGEPTTVPARLIGSGEVLQAKALVDRAAAGNPKQQAAFCEQVSKRLTGDPLGTNAVRLEVVRVRFDPIEYFVRGPEPLEQQTVFSCPVVTTMPGSSTAP
ncbi:MAG TPA: hypothetical protein VHM70_26700 [Polyangiaceae bacterium]|jgi:hypothetical protein|nr:hypothetical protein [Polyangiaceae bacterium]